MKSRKLIGCIAAALAATSLASQSVQAADVKITPLGSQEGEFCQLDRALIFEDPDGTRLLYDAGRTVAGPDDPRLGKIDAVLVSHMHGDHVGDKHIEAPGSGDCKATKFPVNALPNTNSASIAHAKGATIITGSEMPKFFAAKLKSLGGDPKNSQLVRFGDCVACQPAFNRRWQGHRRYPRGNVFETGEGEGPPAFEWPHDVIQQQG
jgi:hypothetical protein